MVRHNRHTATDSRVYKDRWVLSEVMDVRRTAVVKLAVSDEQRDALHRTAEQFENVLCAVSRTQGSRSVPTGFQTDIFMCSSVILIASSRIHSGK